MGPKKIWANLAVSNLERTTQFYTALGFKPNNAGASKELTSFLVGENDFIIHFFLKEVLQANVNGEFIDPKNGNEVIFSLSAESTKEVDQWVQKIITAGGEILIEPREFGNGYYCVFSDPDGHKFNFLYWP